MEEACAFMLALVMLIPDPRCTRKFLVSTVESLPFSTLNVMPPFSHRGTISGRLNMITLCSSI